MPAFQRHAESPGSSTVGCVPSTRLSFQSRAESPDSSTMLGGTPVADWFQSRARSPSSSTHTMINTNVAGFTAVPNHLFLLHYAKVRSELGVSDPCQITLFTCRHLHTHPHTGTRATTAKDSPRARASPHALRTHARRPRRVLHVKREQPSC